METCENCGRKIGNLEVHQLWQNHIVCEQCCKVLDASSYKPQPEKQISLSFSSGSKLAASRGTSIICPNPNCGYSGTPDVRKKAKRGPVMSLIFLWHLFGFMYGKTVQNDLRGGDQSLFIASVACFIGAIGYTIFMHGVAYFCPKCGTFSRNG